MSDPIEELARLGDAMESTPMPLPAAEIRARGDRIRRRRHALVAGASAAVVAAVAVPVVALGVGGSADEPDLAPSPTVSDPVPVPALGAANLLTGDDAVYGEGGIVDWVEADTYPGDGQGAFSPCARSSMSGLGATAVFQREFEFVVVESQEVTPTNDLNETVAEFPSADAAKDAYAEIRGWFDDCLPFPAETYEAEGFAAVPIGVDGKAEAQLSTYGPVEESIDPYGDAGYFLETGLVLAGDRVAVLSQVIVGQDYNFPVAERPVVRMLPAAAERLALGNGAGAPDAAELPPDFPLTAGWPEDDGSDEHRLDAPSEDNQAMLAAGELAGCQDIDGGDPVDRLTSRLALGSGVFVREVQLFEDAEGAAAFADAVQDSYAACAAQGPTDEVPSDTYEVGQGALGPDSWVITAASDGIGRQVVNVLIAGNAVLVDLASDEGAGDTVIDLATQTRENLADVVAALNDLAGAGASGSDGPGPARLTAVPEDFPIDLALDGPPLDSTVPTAEAGVREGTICGEPLSFPVADGAERAEQLDHAVSDVEGYDARTVRAYPTVQDAVDTLEAVRSQVAGCERDDDGDGLSERVWRSFRSAAGEDSVTFGWSYEATEFQPAGAGTLYTVVRVGNAVLALEWGGEWSAEAMATAAPDQVALADVIAAEMCVFADSGC